MKTLTNSMKTTLTRMESIEKARTYVLLVMNENPLTTDELDSFNHVLSVLNENIHMRSNVEFSEEEIQASII